MKIFNRLLLLSFLFLATTSLDAQTVESDAAFKERVTQLLKNKFRTNPDILFDYLKSHPNAFEELQQSGVSPQLPVAQMRGDDVQIADTPEAESELHAAVNPVDSNNIIVSVMKSNPNDFLAPLSFPIYSTHDFGNTWELSSFDGTNNLNGLLGGGGDPIIVFDNDGTAYLTWLTVVIDAATFTGEMALRFATSTDGGVTWTENPQLIDSGEITDLITFAADKLVDKEWLVLDDSPNSLYYGNIYIIYTEIDAVNQEYKIAFRRKSPSMDAFTDQTVYVNSNTGYAVAQFVSLDTDANGVIHATFVASANGVAYGLYYTQSDDGGQSFDTETKIADINLPIFSQDPEAYIEGISNDRLYPCPHTKVDNTGGPHDGNIYSVWTANGTTSMATEGADIYFTKSEDGGETWTAPSVINNDTDPATHQFYPALNINKAGKVIVSFYDRRDDPNNTDTHYYITWSEDGGDTFVENTAVSTEASDFSQIGLGNADFGIGEYNQVISTYNYAIPVWADGRDNNGNIELYTAFVPLVELNTGIAELGTISTEFGIAGPQPNPVADKGIITVTLQKSSHVNLSVFAKDGKLIQQLQNGNLAKGDFNFEINNNTLPTGEYILSLQTDFGFKTKKFVVVK